MAAFSTGGSGMTPPVGLVALMAVAVAVAAGWWLASAVRPPPATPCGGEGGPPVTAPRVQLRDGRFLAYAESGARRDTARFKVVYSPGFSGGRFDSPRASQELLEDLGVYMVGFDRTGYGESDPDPKRSVKSAALDIQDLADALCVGPKFYLICSSLGCHAAWASFNYVPHRLAGAALMAPVINYWWPGFPRGMAREHYRKQPIGDQWSLRVSYYAPWLLHWWVNQTWLPTSTVIGGSSPFPNALDEKNRVMSQSNGMFEKRAKQAAQQGTHESFYRDMAVMFRRWEFDPMDLEPTLFPVHLFQRDEDGVVPVELQQYISGRLGWINYHELPGTGHFLSAVPGLGDRVVSALFPPAASS